MKRKKAAAYGLFVLYLVAVFLLIPVTYAINDDTAMRDIASGAMSGEPDYHLVFVKAALGLALQSLYTLLPGTDWYGCLWLAFILLSAFLVLGRCISLSEKRGKNPIVVSVLFLILFTLTMLWHLVNFQFTVVPAIVAGTAIFLYYTDEHTGLRAVCSPALIVLMIWIAFCIRENVLIMAVPFGGLLFLCRQDSLRKKAVMAGAAALGIAGIMVLETAVYSGAEWQSYREYNEARSVVYDYYGVPPYGENQDFYKEIGLAEYDVVNLERYNLIFVDGLEEGRMQQVAEYAQQKYMETHSFRTRVKDGIKRVIQAELSRENLLLNVTVKLAVLTGLLLGFRYDKRGFLLNLGFLACEGALALYLGYEGRLPERVMAALLLIELLSSLSILVRNFSEGIYRLPEKLPAWAIGLVLLCAAGAAWRFADVKGEQEQRYRANLEYEQLKDYYRANPENVYYISALWVAGYTDNFSVRREARVLNGFTSGGWLSFLPPYEQGLEHFGIQDEDRAILENDRVYYILNTASGSMEKHYEENYGSIHWTEVDRAPVYGMEVPVYQIRGGDST